MEICGLLNIQLGKADLRLCLINKRDAIWIEVLTQEEILTHARKDKNEPIL